MPVPSSIADLSQTPGSNYPTGSESPITTDNYLREYSAYIAQLRDGKNFTDPVTLASATTTDIGAQNSLFVEITGTTTITGFGTTYNGPRFLRFTGILTLTHNATTLNLPGAANIATAAGDTAIVVPNSTPNGWNVVNYFRASGLPILSIAGLAASGANTDITSLASPALGAATATTQASTDDTTKVATTAHVKDVLQALGISQTFTSAEQTVTADSVLNVAHGLGVVPSLFTVVLRCKATVLNYAVGDEISYQNFTYPGVGYVMNVADATNVTIIAEGASIGVLDKSTGVIGNITVGDWRWVVRAWA